MEGEGWRERDVENEKGREKGEGKERERGKEISNR